ncbi:MAG TPA: sigma-70 family RNA polymerase sigma factor [Tepidisphaeraceae bacterium]|jgi:RNA polymerase sigma factor (sigma-70 family)
MPPAEASLTRTSTALLEGLKDRANPQAWQEFDQRYRPLLLAVAARLRLAAADAEDAVQETLAAFVVAYGAGKYQAQAGRLRDWLAGIMVHKVRDLQRRRRPGGSPEALRDVAVTDPAIAEAIEQEWASAVLRDCLERVRLAVLPQTYESFDLFALRDWPAEKVAAHLGVSVDVVYQNKRRVLERIRRLLPTVEAEW